MSAQNIHVAVRCRPLNEREKKQSNICVLECNEKRKEITVFDRNSAISNTKTFTFDKVFGSESKQIDVYNQVVKPVVAEVIEGYNCTIFAYGQTGTGKTFTMEGDRSQNCDDMSWEDDPLVGIIPRSVAQLFSCLKSMQNCEHSVKISYIELYNEELSDLLSEQSIEKDEKLKIYDDPARKGSVLISKLEEVMVQNKNQVYKILQKGAERRQKAATLMNAQSSRSHSIFTVTVFIKEKSIEGEETIKVGKLNLVDLAGSENIERSGATGKRAAEAGKINKSLTTLGRVITALVEHRDHIPYRESNLTRLLQDSLGGRTKTTIIATISPALCNLEETLSTLDYAHKAKSIRNKPEINQKLVKKALIKEYTEEIERLKRELNSAREKNGIYLPADIYQEMESQVDMQKEEIRELLQKIAALSDEMEKLNDLCKENKLKLDENAESLYQAEHKYRQAQNRLETVEQEMSEAKFVLAEKNKFEVQLNQHAKYLEQKNVEAKNDCLNLHEKIERLSLVNTNNKSLAQFFAKNLIEKLTEINSQENEFSSSNKQRLCVLCECLNEIKLKIKQNKEDHLGKLNLFEDKQKTWLDSHQSLIEKEIEVNCQEYFANFAKSLNGQKSNLILSYQNALQVCSEHKESYGKIWLKLKQLLEAMEKSFIDFETDLSDFTNKFLVVNLQETAEHTNKTKTKLNELNESLEATRNDLKELKEFKVSIKSTLTEAFKSFQTLWSNLESRLESTLEEFEKRCDKIENKNEINSVNIGKLKEFIKESENNFMKKFNTEFEKKVNGPIKNLIEANSKNFIELNVLAKNLNDKNDNIHSQYVNSLQSFKMIEEENNKLIEKNISNQIAHLEKTSKKIQFNLKSYKEETEKYFEKLKIESLESDTANLTKMVEETVNATTQAKQMTEAWSESSREFCTTSIRATNEFAEKYGDYMPTGMTPDKNKEYANKMEIPKSRSSEELLEEYRANRPRVSDDFKEPICFQSIPNETSSLPISISNNSNLENVGRAHTTSTKRLNTDKENQAMDMGEKANKLSRFSSSARMLNRARNPVFQDKN